MYLLDWEQGSFVHEHARPLNKRCAWRLTTWSTFIKMALLKAIIAIILLVGLGECARDLTKFAVWKKTLTLSQKRSRPALTYHELLSNSISRLDLDYSVRICSACRIALTSSKSKQSAETFVDVSKHFQFCLFWNRKGTQILKKNIANLSEWVGRCAKAGVQFSSEWIYVLQFSQHCKATTLRAHETEISHLVKCRW